MSSKIPVGVQLWSVHKDITRDLPGALEAIAKMGYQGVETAGLGDTPPKTWRKLLQDCGLGVAGAHVGLETLEGDAFQATLDAYGEIGCRRFNVPGLAGKYTGSLDGYRRACAALNHVAARARSQGCFVGYHNHASEFGLIENRVPFALMLDCLTSDVEVQFDIGNMSCTGADGAAYIRTLPGRAKTLHVKAYKRDAPAALVGEDSVPWASVFDACETVGGTEWYIVEHEEYGSLAPMACIEGCLRNLRAMGK